MGRQSHGRSARFRQGQAASTVENPNLRLAKLERDLRDLDEKVDGWDGARVGWGVRGMARRREWDVVSIRAQVVARGGGPCSEATWLSKILHTTARQLASATHEDGQKS
jgi:hypothetical protein